MINAIRLLFIATLLITFTGPLGAASDERPHGWCGTHPLRAEVDVARHEVHQRRLARSGPVTLTKMATPNVERIGHIGIIEDDGSIIRRANVFDLAGQNFKFLHRPRGVAAVRSAEGFRNQIGDRVVIGDDDSIRFDLEFAFPFGDRNFRSVWVNSDGNLTFGESDDASTPRDINRVLEGPPRIMPLFTDLDPTSTSGESGVFVAFLPSRFRVTWRDVPEFGVSNSNTVQITLFNNGRIEIVYGDTVEAEAAIVGVAPFPNASLSLVDYNQELPLPTQRTVYAEEFTQNPDVDLVQLSRTFYRNFLDIYDFLAVFEDFEIDLGGNAFAFAITINNNTRGIGRAIGNQAAAFGSNGQLETVMQFGHLANYSESPNQLINRTYTTMGLLAHEMGHRWLAFPFFRAQGGGFSSDLIGAGFSHWSHFLDADSSFMEGNDIIDLGNGSFRIAEASTQFSDLDLYLMGLLPPGQVNDVFYVRNASNFSADDVTSVNRIGQTFTGQRVNVSVDQIIAAEGTRRPNVNRSQKDFRVGFVLLTRQGQAAAPGSVDMLDQIRRQYLTFFPEATGNLAVVRSGLADR